MFQMCVLNLDQCPPPVVLTQGKVCYCSEVNEKEDVYHFVIRQYAEPHRSEGILSASYSSNNALRNGIVVFSIQIGKLPLMFGKFSLHILIY